MRLWLVACLRYHCKFAAEYACVRILENRSTFDEVLTKKWSSFMDNSVGHRHAGWLVV